MTVCYRCVVRGRVQGVFFRASTRSEAQMLGVTGRAENLPDGSVEVLACGEPAAVDRLREWLWQGPLSARVDDVECRRVAAAAPSRFTTR
ncbi:MAG: acylphosphatase [Gammaproteobacteria bacterium]|jgi:acylphosphatase